MKRPVPSDGGRAGDQAHDGNQRDVPEHQSDHGLRGSAPSAMRMPISLRRRVTVYDITPYRPSAASSNASPPKNPDSVATQPLLQHVRAEVLVELLEIERDVLVHAGDRLHDGVARLHWRTGRPDRHPRAREALRLLGERAHTWSAAPLRAGADTSRWRPCR